MMPSTRTATFLERRQASPSLLAWLAENAPRDELMWRDPARFSPLCRSARVGDRLLLVEAGLEQVCAAPSPRRLKGVITMARHLGFSRRRIDRAVIARFGIDLYGLEACAVLGVRPDANDPTIKRAYRRLASRVHPDRVAHLGEKEQVSARRRMTVLNAARQRLLEPDIVLVPANDDDVELEPVVQVEVDDVLLEFANLDDDVEL